MNFYAFHIGDYASATRHLSWLEDAAYRRLIDIYYVREEPLPADLRQVYRLAVASTDDHRRAVDVVLDEFFNLTDEGYVHLRCEREIYRSLNTQALDNAGSAKRRGIKLKATPAWLTKEHKESIKDFYRLSAFLSRTTGTSHNVDHIVPLQGKTVCGLHVPWNMQVITAEENQKKHAKFDEVNHG